jgi:GT2 family glycosyltransferase
VSARHHGGVVVELSFCIVNTDQRGLLRYCLDAVARERATLEGRSEVLVLDNASTDGSADAARRHRSEPEVIALTERRPRHANATTLLERASGRFCLLLDEDAELEPGATVALHGALAPDEAAAAAAATLVRPDGQPLASAWHASRRVVRPRGEAVRRVDAVQSAAVLLRRDALAATGWLPEAASRHAEELELSRRLRGAGWRLLYVPTARAVWHGEAAGPGAGAGRLRHLRKVLRRPHATY